jgi:site-specific DNA-methyltransferase (adenine-specific)
MSIAATRARRIYCQDRQRVIDHDDQLLVGDARTLLPTIATTSVDCIITSPPYFLLRNYQHDEQLGLEPTIDHWVAELRIIMRELARIVKPTGGVWLNLGDSYSRGVRYGAQAKSLLLGPERLLLELMSDGWIVRNKVIWAKPNPMPASVQDRLTCSWEPVYFLVRSPSYFFDLDAVREPHVSRTGRRGVSREAKYESAHPKWAGPLAGKNDGLRRTREAGRAGHPLGKNPTDVWRLATATFAGSHFAVYPERLIERPMRLTCPERVCEGCGRAWRREKRRDRLGHLRADCTCNARWHAGLVLDPFLGSGTTAVVAERLGRAWKGIELNPEFARLAQQRIAAAHIRRNDDTAPRAAA